MTTLTIKQMVHSKKCWVVSTQIWVIYDYGQTQMLG